MSDCEVGESTMTYNWLRSLLESRLQPVFGRGRKTAKAGTPARARLWVEVLEDRTLLSTIAVVNGLDDGVGSLRAAVALANADSDADIINFAPGVTAVTLTTDQLTLATDITITG